MTENTDEKSPLPERSSLDSTGEFFSVGAPLHAVRAGYVRRAADDVLFETVVAGRYAHVIAPYRTGKSSLVAATSARLENNGFKVAILDLGQISDRDAGSDEGRWYYSVAYRLIRQLRIRVDLQSWWQDKSILSNRQRLLEFYSEIVLQNIQDRVAIFIDEVQSVADLPFNDQLLPSIRSAHNARATDPEFSRLTFVLLGECDPLSLITESELSPFNVTQAVALRDFTREELGLFATELNLSAEDATAALDRIFYWTSGQPYLSQKLARAISREQPRDGVAAHVDRIVANQLTGRSALHNEPHLSHIHRAVVNDEKFRGGLLNLFGRISKGLNVPTDLGSQLQRRLVAVGLLVIDADGKLVLRNRVYEAVFTTRWANENLPTHWRTLAWTVAAVAAVLAVPFWYTQLLPRGYVDVLTSDTAGLAIAEQTYSNFRSFPGHTGTADHLYRSFLQSRARAAESSEDVDAIAAMTAGLPDAGRLPDEMRAAFRDRQAIAAMREERRDDALLASLESLLLSTPLRRRRAAALVGDDYPHLLASLSKGDRGNVVFNPGSTLLTETRDAQVSQWSLGTQGLERRADWTLTALEVAPLVRRVIVDREGRVNRVGLTLNLSHARVSDLRIKVIAPSGRAVEVNPPVDAAFSTMDIQIPPAQMADLIGEPLNGTWSLSVRDEELGVAGRLVGWNLKLNSQGVIEDFQRGLNIGDPIERNTDQVWFSADGRYAVARAMQSDSARVWDLAFAKPVRAIAVSEFEQVIGLGAGARMLVTATQSTVSLWDTATGKRVAALPVGPASASATLNDAGTHLFVQRRGDADTRFELWSLADAAIESELTVAGIPALVALDARGRRIAVADYDRAVRIWDLGSRELVAQIDLLAQPSEIRMAAAGDVLGVVFGSDGASLWRVDRPGTPIVRQTGSGRWQLAFSPSGTRALLGRAGYGFQTYATRDGLWLGPPLGMGADAGSSALLGFSADEQVIVTGGPDSTARFWRAPAAPAREAMPLAGALQDLWPASGNAVAVVTGDATTVVIGDHQGDVHFVPVGSGTEELLEQAQRVSFLGHSSPVRRLAVSRNGSTVVSVADDNSIRVWDPSTGLPQPFFAGIHGNPVEALALAPDGTRVALMSSNRVYVMDAADGRMVARFELGVRSRAMSFADDGSLYLGNESGALQVVAQDASGAWSYRTIWQGEAALRGLAVSPRSRYLVVVDAANRAMQFGLAEGKLGDMILDLPSTIEEVSFAPGGTRVLFRTQRWVHRASSALTGLVWLDAAIAPQGLAGAGMVFGASDDGAAALANRVYLPVPGNGFVRLAQVDFGQMSGPGLFGNRDTLLDEWRRKLGREPDAAN